MAEADLDHVITKLNIEATMRDQKERDELSADLYQLRQATRIRLSKKAVASLKELLETMEAMDEKDAPALRILIEMHDKLERL